MSEEVAEAQLRITIGPLDDPEVKFYYFPLNPAPTVLHVIAELGIPDCPAESCVLVITTGAMYGSALKDYTAEYFGVWVRSVEEYYEWLKAKKFGDCYPSSSIYYPNPQFRKIGIEADHVVFWRRRVFFKADEAWQPDDTLKHVLSPAEPSAVFLEAVWSPNRGDSISVRGLESVPTKRRVPEAKRLLIGMPLISFRQETRGRNREYETKKDFLDDLALARQMAEEQGSRVTQESVAEYLRCDSRQVRAWLRRFGIRWRDWLKSD